MTKDEELIERAANIAYRVCAETRHVTLGDKAANAIRAELRPADRLKALAQPVVGDREAIADSLKHCKALILSTGREIPVADGKITLPGDLTDIERTELLGILSFFTPVVGGGWLPIEQAPRDGSYILAIVAPNDSRHLQYQAGRMFVIRHEGKTDSGFDMGWAVYPGYGGASDHNFTHFRPLPDPPAPDPNTDRAGMAQEVE